MPILPHCCRADIPRSGPLSKVNPPRRPHGLRMDPERTCKSFCGRYNLLTRVANFPCCRSRTDSVKSVEGQRCSRLRLHKLGLGQYAQRFAKNDITFAILPDLTNQDLKEIGVSPGHRRQLPREIANLSKAGGAPTLAPSVSAPPIAATCGRRRRLPHALASSRACRSPARRTSAPGLLTRA
jgi:hypothetical protein